MKLKHDPCLLILSEGDDATKLAFLSVLGLERSAQAKDCLISLLKRQRSDGGFPSQLDPQRWGMRETVRHALLLLEVGLPADGINVDAAVRFIVAHRNGDGAWCENAELKLPPEQTWLSGGRSIVWLTADVVDLLRRVGQGASSPCHAALQWLRAMQTRRGGWPSLARGVEEEVSDDPDATAQVTFLIADVYGENEPVYRRGRELFERHLDRCARDAERGYRVRACDGEHVELDVYHLTHLLLSWLLDPPRRFRAGYDAGDPRVRRMMEALIDLQDEDGGWRPFFAEEGSPVYTALAVRALILSGTLGRAALQECAVPYAR